MSVEATNQELEQEREEAKTRMRQQAAIAELGQLALMTADLYEVMDKAAALVAQTLQVDYAKVLELLPAGDALLLRAGIGWRAGLVGRATVGAGSESQAGYTLLTNQPVIVRDLRTETRFSGPPLLHEHGVVSGMSVVIRGRERPYGVLGAHTIRPREFTPDDVRFLQAIANMLASTVARKRTEEELARLAAIVESSGDAIIGKTLDGAIVSWNKGAEKIYGYTADEVIGKPISILASPGQTDEVPQILARIGWGESIDHYETTRKCKDGRPIAVSLVISPIRDAFGKIVGASTIARDITERKRAEEAARSANAYHRSLIEASLDPLVTIGPDGKITDVNAATEKVTGCAREELVGTDFSDYFTEPERARAGYQQVFREGWVQDYALEIRHRDGHITPVLYNASVYRDKAGQVIGVFAAARDITERVRIEAIRTRAEKAVEAERRRFNDVLDMLPAYVVLLTPDYHVPFANRFFRERFGESHGRRCFEYLFGYTEPCETCETYTVLKTNAPQHWEWIGPDGRNYDIFDFPFIDVDGSPLIMEAGIDITERKRAGEALRFANAYNRSLIEASLDPLVTIGLDGKITDVNAATEKVTGCTREELVGTDFSDYFTEPERARAGYQQVFREGWVQDYALEIRHRDGHITPVLYNASVYRDEAGQVIGVFAAARDITERERARDAIRQLNAELEQRVEERTRELTTLLAISHNMTSTLELRPLLSLILDQLKGMVDYTGAVIYLVEGEDLSVMDYRGPVSLDQALRMRFPIEGAAGYEKVIRERSPLIIADIQGNTPVAQAYRKSPSPLQWQLLGQARSWVGVPLIVKDQVIGMLRLSHDEPGYYASRHVQLALAIASQAAVAIENARLYEQAQQMAALQERQRLARELHDSVSQALYGISLGVRTAQIVRDHNPAKLDEALSYILSLTNAALMEMRALIFELRPESLQMEGLVAALTKRTAALQAHYQIIVKAELCEEPDLPLKMKEALYRIAQEAMHNIVKHACATRVDLQLGRTDEELVLEIADNGVGFNPAQTFAGHLGLHSMHERVARLHGALNIESAPGQGTRIRVRIPL